MKFVFAEMSLKRASSCVPKVSKIKKICSDSSLALTRSSESVVTSSQIDESVEGDSYNLMPLFFLSFYFFEIRKFSLFVEHTFLLANIL